MKIRARCNKRDCQARRNLSKPLEQYVRRPKCHRAGCDGLMYVDKYRQRKGEHDNAPTCYMDCLPYPHRVNTHECRQYEEWVLNRSTRPRSKHSPLTNETDEEAPF